MKINGVQGSVSILNKDYMPVAAHAIFKRHEIGSRCQLIEFETLCEQNLSEPIFMHFISAVLQMFGKAGWYKQSLMLCCIAQLHVSVVKAYKYFVHNSALL